MSPTGNFCHERQKSPKAPVETKVSTHPFREQTLKEHSRYLPRELKKILSVVQM